MSHKENCQWEDIYINIYDSNPCGADTSLTVEEDHLFYDSNVHKKDSTEEDIYISFNYCPCCGEEL